MIHFGFIIVIFKARSVYIPGWPQTQSVAGDDLEPPIPLLSNTSAGIIGVCQSDWLIHC